MNRYDIILEKTPPERVPELNLHVHDVSALFTTSNFRVYQSFVAGGGKIHAIKVKGIANMSRSFFDEIVRSALSQGAKGLTYMVSIDKIRGPIVKFLTETELGRLVQTCGIDVGDVVFLMAGDKSISNNLCIKIGNELDPIGREHNTCE